MKITNTLTGQIEELKPSQKGVVNIYVCGVTPYADAHVGHAMSLMVYDILVRYLRWTGNKAGGYKVNFVSNYTDIDDKLIEKGLSLNKDPIQLAEDQIIKWEDEQKILKIDSLTRRPRVTEEIEAICQTIQKILDNGFGYITSTGNVYFRVRSQPNYGKLSRRSIDDLQTDTTSEDEVEKESPLDFALWKAKKQGEPSWDSRWGQGRPGWHIECSTMAQKYLGDTFDIHGGGVDLIFPHHENEIAQAEAVSGKSFANIWMHNGMVLYQGEKMSKSLGNVVSVAEAIDRWGSDALRLFVLNSYYRGPNNLTDDAMAGSVKALDRLRRALETPSFSGKKVEVETVREQFIEVMEDDLSTAKALAILFDLARDINRGSNEGYDITEAQEVLRELLAVLGLEVLASRLSTEDIDHVSLVELAQVYRLKVEGCSSEDIIVALIELRSEARKDLNYNLADEIRSQLQLRNIELEDALQETKWSVI
ncbi:MAG: cysteine--tRNA ligase [Chloroflexi bacterium]|nr:cysteine--tRNA ligase [Chloroflexota bacterium]|tara:strand:+ start:3258 stop:4694 length:1437 start_codon:yes stop_codon:yes gene_type:complete